MLKYQSVLALICFATSCRTGTTIGQKGPADALSKTSTISINPPDKNQVKAELRDKLSGYRLAIDPLDDSCANATRVNQTAALSQTSLSASLVQGCDYVLGLEFGLLATSGTALDAAYFSNATGPKTGLTIKKEEFIGKTDLAVSITVKITQAGIDAGFGKPGGIEIVPPAGTGTGSVIINASIGGQNGVVTPTSTVATPPPQTVTFADVKGTAQQHCLPCHAQASDETWWTSKSTTIRAQLGSGGMPKPGSAQVNGFTPDVKQKLLNFLK